MNLKLVAVPLIILTIIIFSVWIFHPAYKEMKDSSQNLSEEKGKLENFESRAGDTSRLSSDLEANSSRRNVLYDYIPSERKDENIISDINDISFVNGLSVLEISFSEEQKSSASVTDAFGMPVTMDPTTGEPAKIDPITGEIIVATAPEPKNIDVRMVAIGEYGQIKAALKKLANLKRYNKLKSIKIYKDSALSQGNEDNSQFLKIEATISFNYLKGVKKIISLDNEILNRQGLDFSIADKISQEKDTQVPDINIISEGRNNPFVLSGE